MKKATYQVWSAADEHQSYPPRPRTITASSPTEAAEKWAYLEDVESVDFTIVKGQPEDVVVKAGNGQRFYFTVSGQPVPKYTAKPTGASRI